MNPEPLDLGKVIPDWTPTTYSDLVNSLLGNAAFLALMASQSASAANAALENLKTTVLTNEGSDAGKVPTSATVYNALHFAETHVVTPLTGPTTWNPPTLNTEHYIGNNGVEENSLEVILPAAAAPGDTFFLEFRSTGAVGVPAVLTLSVEDGGAMFTHGETSEDAHLTRVSAVFQAGAWIVDIDTFTPHGIPQVVTKNIVYSGANRGYFSSLASASVTETGIVGNNVLKAANLLAPSGSVYTFGNLYGMEFAGWNTAQNGSGTTYSDGATVEIASGSDGLTLYPMYTPLEKTGVNGPQAPASTITDALGGGSTTQSQTIAISNAALQALGIRDYKELSLKVKVTAKATATSNMGDNAWGRVYHGTAATGTLLAEVNGNIGSAATGTSGWITLTRSSSTGTFEVPLTYEVEATGRNPKSAKLEAQVTAIRIE